MVAGPEEHEAAWPHHRFDFRPYFLHVFPCDERLVYLRVELPQLLFEGFDNPVKWFVGHHSNVVDRDASDIHRVTSLGRQSRLVVKKVAAEDKSRQRETNNHQIASMLVSHFSLLYFSFLCHATATSVI